MDFEATPIGGLFVAQRNSSADTRGIFSRLYAAEDFSAIGRPMPAVHVNASTSTATGTLRGIHFQYPPRAEAKIVACVSGLVWDVAVDLRPNSVTQFKWFGIELSAANGRSLVVPEGFGHAFVTLEPNSTVVYVSSEIYSPGKESGVRFDDPLVAIDWPLKPVVVSEKDSSWPLLESRIDEHNARWNLAS